MAVGSQPFAVDGFNTHHKFSGLFRNPRIVISAKTSSFADIKSIVATNFYRDLFTRPNSHQSIAGLFC